jgi:hypothetical protein
MILIGTTLAAFSMSQKESWSSWLSNADQVKQSYDGGVEYFAAIEVDARGIEPFAPLVEELNRINATYFTFSLDDGRTEVTTSNRLRHITTGRNIVSDYAMCLDASHLLYLDADLAIPDDTLPKLLEMNHPLVGGNVPAYCLGGPVVSSYPFPVEAHWNTAGFLLAEKRVYSKLKWRYEPWVTDDPCFAADAKELLGVETYVRKDLRGMHWPPILTALENRPYDRTVVR